MTEINLFPKFVDEAASPVAKRIGSTLSSVWDIVFGGVDSYAERKDYIRVQKLDNFKQELDEKVNNIPPENLTEPKLHILGPTIEASKYYFENDELRQMFSNLVASSLNIKTAKDTHPSFVEIIKQLSPLDAMNLKVISQVDKCPIVEYKIKLTEEKGEVTLFTNVFLENKQVNDTSLNATSLDNLYRLGVIKIDFTRYLTNHEVYNKFKLTPEYKYCEDIVLKDNSYNKVDIQKGILDITPFGSSFIKICL